MKKVIFIFGLSLALLSCGKDEEETIKCSVSDFVGVWTITGGEACILNQANTLTITDSGNSQIKPVYTGNGITSQFDNWTVTDCGFTGKVEDTDFALDITVSGTLKDGKLTITNKGTFLGAPVNCTENLTK